MSEHLSGAQYKELYRYKLRRARVILAQFTRRNGHTSHSSRTIISDMNAKICIECGISFIKELPADKMDDCIRFIHSYRYSYFGALYG